MKSSKLIYKIKYSDILGGMDPTENKLIIKTSDESILPIIISNERDAINLEMKVNNIPKMLRDEYKYIGDRLYSFQPGEFIVTKEQLEKLKELQNEQSANQFIPNLPSAAAAEDVTSRIKVEYVKDDLADFTINKIYGTKFIANVNLDGNNYILKEFGHEAETYYNSYFSIERRIEDKLTDKKKNIDEQIEATQGIEGLQKVIPVIYVSKIYNGNIHDSLNSSIYRYDWYWYTDEGDRYIYAKSQDKRHKTHDNKDIRSYSPFIDKMIDNKQFFVNLKDQKSVRSSTNSINVKNFLDEEQSIQLSLHRPENSNTYFFFACYEYVDGFTLHDIKNHIGTDLELSEEDKLNIIDNVRVTLNELEQRGYYYDDFHFENVIYNPQTKKITIIDLDSIKKIKRNEGIQSIDYIITYLQINL
jgi:hypothetical protein